ncbi:reverse transcriptase [Apostichopus japonicus]|uniref:Reverse transcriptase n=1 Tax=Stichopus japonicus TaxID=307972 RepID=A0A2G8JSI3_STIJA|nr:reverse transcriptase [Apostichopus japonicus]
MSQVAHQTLRNSVLRDPRTASKRKILEAVRGGEVWRPLAVIALQTYLDEKYHGARVRARVEAVEAEERPSLRFYQSVSSSAGDRRVPSVALLMGPWLVTLTALSAYIKSIFEFVYAWQCRLVGTGDLLRGISKTVPHDVNDILGGEITTVELWKALSKMKNGKSPGSDGLPREFYRTFWAIIGPDIRAVFEDAFQNGLLNQSQRLGMITLLPSLGTPWIP